MSEKRFTIDGVEVERFMMVFGDDGTRIVDNQTNKELYAIECCDLLNQLCDENEQLKHWNKCLAEKRHNEKESNESLIKKLIGKIDFLERIIDGEV